MTRDRESSGHRMLWLLLLLMLSAGVLAYWMRRDQES